MRLLRYIVLANALAAVLLAGVVIAMRPRDVQGGVVSRGNAMGIVVHTWSAVPTLLKAPHGKCADHVPKEINGDVGPTNQETGVRFYSSRPPSGKSLEES